MEVLSSADKLRFNQQRFSFFGTESCVEGASVLLGGGGRGGGVDASAAEVEDLEPGLSLIFLDGCYEVPLTHFDSPHALDADDEVVYEPAVGEFLEGA